ncbi:TetR family transcriptional regulator [Litorimonas taeanensis]|uniref:TetR family transcriptional regulator n=1 Tax=Litorimonas taeanensis TaxID=568099 RepID=A0A420WEZ4_9PROT|nr:TetR/AcrR family transcriptional regulator [Litorimonas taeanensis]RKQ69556.1 TetR family transcriptional regulator [Litorimonas taeanensis]
MKTETLPDPDGDLPAIIAAPDTGKGRIERAALQLFSIATIEGVSTKRIAQAASVSEGLLYKHYKSKDALARALMLAIDRRLTHMITDIAGMDISLDDKVRRITVEYCRIADADWALFRYHILHLHRFPNLSESPNRSPHGAASDLLSDAMNKGEIASEDPALLAAMALGVVLQTAQSKILGLIEGPLLPQAGRLSMAVLAILGLEG